jgi:leader peptidase (prepilin peptidase)/N-methyltransferase
VNVPLLAAVAVPGLAIGSFLNVVASRVPVRRSVAKGTSRCTSCDEPIRPRDNIPLLSYALLRGRCRSCGTRIAIRYPVVEASTAVLAVVCFLRFGLGAYAVLAAGFCAVLVALAAIDVEHRIVPNRIVVPAAAVVLVAHTLIDPSPEWALGAFGAAAFLLAAALAYPRGMGMGDVKLCLLVGAMLGRHVVIALFLGMIAGLLPACIAAAQGRSVRKLAIPFVPFLAFGSIVALLFGERIVDAYLRLF